MTRERLQKYLARCGVASRRASEQIILDGRVAINDRIVTELGTTVDPENDRIDLDGRAVAKTLHAGHEIFVKVLHSTRLTGLNGA